MKMKQIYVAGWIVGVIVLLATCNVPTHAAQKDDVCSDDTLPAPIRASLQSNFDGWRPEGLADLGQDDLELWTKNQPKDCPGIAIGHFERADALIYAVLLVPKSKTGTGYKLVLFSEAPGTNAFTWKLLENYEKDNFAPVIWKLPPGKYTSYTSGKTIRLALDGLNVEWLEKSSYIFYWFEGRYHKIWISD
jgi:hypothetical protein